MRVEIVDDNRDDCPAGRIAVLEDVQVAVLRELPDGLRGVRLERRFPAQQALVPRLGGVVIADTDAGEEVDQSKPKIGGRTTTTAAAQRAKTGR